MSASQAVESIKEHFEAFVKSAEEKLEQDLPKVEETVTAAESNPVVQAVSAAVHLPEVPDLLSALASFVTVVDGALGKAKEAGAAAAAPQPEQAPAQPA